MRIRTIKPEFYQSETMARVPREVRDLAKGLINWSDDEGYFKSHPRLIAGSLYPFDTDGPEFVASGLGQLAGIGFVQLFEGGIGFLPNFETNQRINRATDSKLKPKALVLLESSVSPHTQLSEVVHREGKGSGREVEQGSGGGKEPQTAVGLPATSTDIGGSFQSWVNDARAEVGLPPEQPIADIGLKLSPLLLELNGDVERLKLGYLEFLQERKFWAKQKPKHPLRGFLSQALDFVPAKAPKPEPPAVCAACGGPPSQGRLYGFALCPGDWDRWANWQKPETTDEAPWRDAFDNFVEAQRGRAA